MVNGSNPVKLPSGIWQKVTSKTNNFCNMFIGLYHHPELLCSQKTLCTSNLNIYGSDLDLFLVSILSRKKGIKNQTAG